MEAKKYLFEIPDDPNHAANKVLNWIAPHSDVLEVGCASGIQTRVLKDKKGCRVTGLEINPAAAEDAKVFCEDMIVGSIEQLDLAQRLGEKKFDFIMFIDVLEHLTDPRAALNKVAPFLKTGGQLIASIPNIAHAAICWELAHGRFDYQQYGLLDNTHIRFFTKKTIIKLFEEAGYQILAWDKVTKIPEETEFNINFSSAGDREFLNWIKRHNPEADTYQFIVRTQLAEPGKPATSYQRFEEQEAIRQLEITVEELKQQNLKLESQLKWLEDHRFGPLSTIFNQILPKN